MQWYIKNVNQVIIPSKIFDPWKDLNENQLAQQRQLPSSFLIFSHFQWFSTWLWDPPFEHLIFHYTKYFLQILEGY